MPPPLYALEVPASLIAGMTTSAVLPLPPEFTLPAEIRTQVPAFVSSIFGSIESFATERIFDRPVELQSCDCSDLMCTQPIETCGRLWFPFLEGLAQTWLLRPATFAELLIFR
jgi:hypothetical protein